MAGTFALNFICRPAILWFVSGIMLGAAIPLHAAPQDRLTPEQQQQLLRQREEETKRGIELMMAEIQQARTQGFVQQPVWLGSPFKLIQGQFTGMRACGMPGSMVQMTLNQDSHGKLSGTLTEEIFSNPYSMEGATPGFSFDADYSPTWGFFYIKPRPARTGGNLYRPFTGIVDVAGDTIILRSWNDGDVCTPLLLKRGSRLPSEWAHVADLHTAKAARRSNWFGQSQPGCSEQTLRWLEQSRQWIGPQTRNPLTIANTANLFAEPYFSPVFGKPFLQLSGKQQQALVAELRVGCISNPAFRQLSNVFTGVTESVFQPSGTINVTTAIFNLGQTALRGWQQDILRLSLERADQAPDELKLKQDVVDVLQPLLAILWPAEANQFLHDLDLRMLLNAVRNSPFRNKELHDIEALAARLTEVRSILTNTEQQQLSSEMSRMLDNYLPVVAAATLPKLSNARETVQLTAWQSRYPAMFSFVSEPTRQRLDQLFAKGHQDGMQGTLAKRTKLAEDIVASKDAADLRLRNLVKLHNETVDAFADSIAAELWQGFLTKQAGLRRTLLPQAQSAILGQLASVTSRGGVDRLLALYLIEQDSKWPESAAVVAAATERRTKLSPFAAYPFGEYLDAIYGADNLTIYRLDGEYFDRIKAAQQQFHQQRKEQQGGGGPSFVDVVGSLTILADSQKQSLVAPIAADYVLNYETYFKACLGPDAMVVRRQITTIDYKDYGDGVQHETARREQERTAVVKPALLPLADQLSLLPSDVTSWLRAMYLFKDTTLTDMRASLKQLMQQHRCDSSEVLQFEQNLQALFDELI